MNYNEVKSQLDDYESIFDAVRDVDREPMGLWLSITDVLDLPLFGDEEILSVKDIKSNVDNLLNENRVYLYTYPDRENRIIELEKREDTVYLYICKIKDTAVSLVRGLLRKEFSTTDKKVSECLDEHDLYTEIKYCDGEDIDYLYLWNHLMYKVKTANS